VHVPTSFFFAPFKRLREEKEQQQKQMQEERLQRALERAQANIEKKVSAGIHRNTPHLCGPL